LEKLAERPCALRRCDGQNWKDIEKDLAVEFTNDDLFVHKLSEIIDPSTFEATILNPTRKVTEEQAKLINDLSKGHVIVLPNDGKFTREEYVEFINDAHISCNLFTNEVHGGLTHVEAMMAGCIMVAPSLNDYLHKYADSNNEENYPFLIRTVDKQIDMNDFVDRLKLAVISAQNEEAMYIYSEMNKMLAYKYASYVHSAEIIVSDLNKLLELYNK
jgi:glycosyltransferase involved in cell wall biosynthesis